MNIKNNIINYLQDNNYVISLYDNYIYIYKYNKLLYLNSNKVSFKVDNKKVTVDGLDLMVTKMTDSELLIKGIIKHIDIEEINEKD